MYRKDKLPEELHDLLGLRIVLTPAASSGIDTDADAVEEEGRGKRRKSKARAALRGHTAKTKGALPPASSYVETRGEAGAGAAGAIVEMVTTTSRAGTATAVAAVATAAAGSSLAGDSRVEEGGFFGAGAVGGGDGGLEGRALEAWLCHGVRELIVDMWEEVPGVRLFNNLCVPYVCIGGVVTIDDPFICL